MITAPTVFILGAGASMPYGFPLGADLVTQICQASKSHLEPFGVKPMKYEEFETELRNSGQTSVDAFLEHRREFLEVGRTAIAYHLIGREDVNDLMSRPRDWYGWLLDKMTAATPFGEFKNNKVSFITFNYDRSLEHILFSRLRSLYGKSQADVADVLNGFQIVHVHGRMGYLPWQKSDTEKLRGYNTETSPEAVAVAADGIKIISENKDGSPEFENARQLMKEATTIAFLGFGYHPVNMRRLGFSFDTSRQQICGTCFDMTEAEKSYLMSRYQGLRLAACNHKCLDMLRNTDALQSD